jgi:hypothetical protein
VRFADVDTLAQVDPGNEDMARTSTLGREYFAKRPRRHSRGERGRATGGADAPFHRAERHREKTISLG